MSPFPPIIAQGGDVITTNTEFGELLASAEAVAAYTIRNYLSDKNRYRQTTTIRQTDGKESAIVSDSKGHKISRRPESSDSSDGPYYNSSFLTLGNKNVWRGVLFFITACSGVIFLKFNFSTCFTLYSSVLIYLIISIYLSNTLLYFFTFFI